ncbi:MAG: DUF3445 domain-containing protein [Pseudomonadota bacterium]
MKPILQQRVPAEMCHAPRLPGAAPCAPDDWLRVDDVYEPQMEYRVDLIAAHGPDVLYTPPQTLPVQRELLEAAIMQLPRLGFLIRPDHVICPDGRAVPLCRDAPLWTLGHLVQEDLCLLEKRGEEHVLIAGVVCFPASWRLPDKAGKPLSDIHQPVTAYDAQMARRVQRLFDGVRVGRPLWRFNRLEYADADLYQPGLKIENAPMPYLRSERQCIFRLPISGAVAFSIHTWVTLNEPRVNENAQL